MAVLQQSFQLLGDSLITRQFLGRVHKSMKELSRFVGISSGPGPEAITSVGPAMPGDFGFAGFAQTGAEKNCSGIWIGKMFEINQFWKLPLSALVNRAAEKAALLPGHAVI